MTLTHHITYNHNNQTLQYRVCDLVPKGYRLVNLITIIFAGK